MIKIKVQKDQAFVVMSKALFKQREGIRRGLHEIGIIAVREAKRLIIEPPKTGILYRIRGQLHRASSQGEAPASFTGTLERSLGYKVSSPTQMFIGARASYGGFLEEGTPGGKIKPRPYLSAAAKNTAKEATNAMLMATQREFI